MTQAEVSNQGQTSFSHPQSKTTKSGSDEIQQQLTALKQQRAVATEEYEEAKRVANEKYKVTLQLFNEQRELEQLLAQQLYKEAQEREAKANEIDFDNPDFQKLFNTAKSHPTFAKLRPFQQEAVVFFLDRTVKGAKGLINGDDMGLGKSAVTAMYLLTLENGSNK